MEKVEEDKIKIYLEEYFKKELGEESECYKTLKNRLANMNIKALSGKEFVEYYKAIAPEAPIPQGFYNSNPNIRTVFLNQTRIDKNPNTAFEIIIYESVHAISDDRANSNRLGFKDYSDCSGSMFNEMATCYITKKIIGHGNGGAYSKDTRETFNAFIELAKISDKELFEMFFTDNGEKNGISHDVELRFNKENPSSLRRLIQLYDDRFNPKAFNLKEVIDILEESKAVNDKKNNTRLLEGLYDYYMDR